MPGDSKHRVLLIDAYSLFFRAFYALPGLSTSRGEPTGAVYGVASMLLRFFKDERPDFAAAAFDRPGPTFRHELFPAYKGHRPEMPDDLRLQMPALRELIEAFDLPIYEADGYEADDVIGTLARQAEAEGASVAILTGDKDALQLVTEGTQVFITRRGTADLVRYDADEVKKSLGVLPEQVVDWKALVGDKSDNIPGVQGVGPKTAVKLLEAYGSLPKVLEHASEVKGQVGRRLVEEADAARTSYALARIDSKSPVRFDWERAKVPTAVPQPLIALFERLEFARLLSEVASLAPAGEAAAEPLVAVEPVAATHVIEPGRVATWSAEWSRHVGPLFTFVLIDADDVLRAHRMAWVICRSAGEGSLEMALVPLWDSSKAVAKGEDLRPLLEAKGLVWVAHDAKALELALDRVGAAMPAVADDLMLASYVLNPGQGEHSLVEVALQHGGKAVDIPALVHKGKPTAWAEVADAAARVCAVLVRSIDDIRERIEEYGVEPVYREVELPLTSVLARMERAGVAIDREYLAELSGRMAERIAQTTADIYELAGAEFNLNSPKQLAEVLFDRLGLPVTKKTKTGPSTSAEVLEELADEHEIVSRILDYRQIAKLKSTYVDALPALVDPGTGRLHTHYRQTIAATGRLSSMHPNLQNIPIRTDEGRQIRKAFIPGDAHSVLLAADYSQIELRVLAHMAGDVNLIEAFQAGADIHTKTAAEIFGLPQDEVTARVRDAAKAINFGIVYGISSFGLARGTGLTRTEAQEYIDAYFERYPQVKAYMVQSVDQAKQKGYAETLMGRRRRLPDITSRNWNRRSFAERMAINTPIQGSAADIIKSAMLKVQRLLDETSSSARLLMQVHDELVFEVPQSEATDLAVLVRTSMEDAAKLVVPLQVDVKAGPNWLDMEAV